MKSLGIFLALLFLAVGAAVAQEHPTVAAQPNTVYVGADGKFEAAPDTAQIQFNVSVQDDTSQAAYQHASKEVEQVRQVLRANGLDLKTATVGFMSVQPVYDYKDPKRKVIGYRVDDRRHLEAGRISPRSDRSRSNSPTPMSAKPKR